MAFVPAPARSASVDPAVAAGAVVVATAPMSAEAFVFKGKEYFDVFYGIEPLAWAFCGFVIVYYGAVVKNAAQKWPERMMWCTFFWGGEEALSFM
ncbi:unnamed protein product [Durusdinium trenchii]|uniref:Uncharacterized protein n=1 Tax=Durusdinium trenchii TaxID=1381693 RepID=A0ABP0KQB8_9DINO